MEYLISLIGIMFAALFTNNIVLSQTLGICPFLGVSKRTDSAVGMGIAVTFVIVLSSVLSYILYAYVLVPLKLQYLMILLFILVIASLVQLLEIVMKKFTPALYNSMGIYLPLITTNCAVLATAQAVAGMENADLLKVVLHALFIGLGFLLALVLMGSIREKLERSEIPKAFQGFPIALIAAGIISLAFVGFSNIELSLLLGA